MSVIDTINWRHVADWQLSALREHCRLACETGHPNRRKQLSDGYSLVMSVNSGYE